jgi:glutaredoxin
MKALSARTGGATSVPQIIVDDKYFGDLVTLREYFKNLIVKEVTP